MIKINPIQIFTYLAQFDEVLPALAGYFARQRAADGLLLGAYMDGAPCGCAVAREHADTLEIVHIAAGEGYRKNGVCKSLMGFCAEHARQTGKKRLCLTYTQERPSGDFFDEYLRRAGFRKHPYAETRVIPVSDKAKMEWNAFMSGRGNAILQRLAARGFEAKNYLETEPAIIEALYEGMGVEFPSWLDPRRCLNEIMNRHSFVTVSRGRPAAYCIASTADGGHTAIIEYMASSSSFLHSGAFFLCLASSVESIVKEGKCAKVAFMVHNGNTSMNKLAANILRFSDVTVKSTASYHYEL